MESIASLHRAPLQRRLPAEMAGGFARTTQNTDWPVAAMVAGQPAEAPGGAPQNTQGGVIY